MPVCFVSTRCFFNKFVYKLAFNPAYIFACDGRVYDVNKHKGEKS